MNLEIFSDLICPWCFIGKRRLDQALAVGDTAEGLNIIWRAYQLYPGIPYEGMARDEFMRLRFGSADVSKGRDQLRTEAARVGIELNSGARMPNTFKGHRLLHHARAAGVQHDLADALFVAYFEQGLDVGEDKVLLDAAESVGMPRQETADFLVSEAATDAVQAELTRAANVGVSGVPCFLFAGAFALPGAQEPEVIRQVIERAKTRLAESA
ncbi:MAG: DsbA family oxidoreductase [Pseudomonadota bacterium]